MFTRAKKYTICALALLAPGVAWAQSTFGSFIGNVKDPSGAAVAQCIVTIKNTATGAERSVLTDAQGAYMAVNMEPSKYEISMAAPGFEKKTFAGVELTARQEIRIDGALSVAAQTQTVFVEGAAAPINTEVSNIAETKLGRELTDLPVAIGSRATGSTSAFATLTTQPGVEIDNNNNLSVAGSKPSMLSVSIDGISSVSPRNTAAIPELFPSFDGIAEIRVSEINNTRSSAASATSPPSPRAGPMHSTEAFTKTIRTPPTTRATLSAPRFPNSI